LLLEICNDGGRMVDFGSAAHGDYFSISDGYDPLSNRRAFFDAGYVLPPAMLETYVEKWAAPRIENFRYMLRSGMMGWFSLMQDAGAWTAEQQAAAREEFALYKRRLRPLIREADLYHVSNRPDGVHWDGIEYFDPRARRGVLFAFRGSSPEQDLDSHSFALRGLPGGSRYHVVFQDRSSEEYTASGEQLTRPGLTVRLRVPNSSELVFFDELK
jgi:alpha-galactosidase